MELLLTFSHPEMLRSEVNRWEYDWVNKIEKIIETNSEAYKGNEMILVADDDENVRNVILSILTDYGYQIILALDGNDALHKFNQHINDIKLIILDCIMPYKNGGEVHKEIMLLNSKTKIIFTSGYRANDIQWLDEKQIIYKPFSPLEILKCVRTALDQA